MGWGRRSERSVYSETTEGWQEHRVWDYKTQAAGVAVPSLAHRCFPGLLHGGACSRLLSSRQGGPP